MNGILKGVDKHVNQPDQHDKEIILGFLKIDGKTEYLKSPIAWKY